MKETVKLLRVCDTKVVDADLLYLSEAFYAKLEMVDSGYDADKENLKYFELSSDKALEITGRCQ